MSRRPLHVFAVFAIPSLLGGITGRLLLERMNRDAPALADARHRDEAPRPPRPTATPSARLVVVVIDGVGERYFDRAARDGVLRPVTWTQRFDTGTPSLSRPSYHVMFTGVPQEAAAIRNNLHRGRARADTVMDRLRDEGATVAWALETVDWMHSLAGLPHEDWLRLDAARDPATLVTLARGHTLTVVHWVTPDETAHAEGRDSAAYEHAVATCFERASRLHDRLAEAFGDEGFTLLVGADHGHVAHGGHGGPERDVVETEWVRLGGPRIAVPPSPRRPEGALAATLTNILGVAPPRSAAVCPVPFPGVTSRADCAAIEARGAALDARVRVIRSEAYNRARVRLAVFAFVALVSLVGVRPAALRRRAARALAAAFALSVGASLAFALLGPGVTLSAIRSERAYVVHAGSTLLLGAALAWPLVRRLTSARTLDTAVAMSLAPLAALIYTADRAGQAMLDVRGQLLAPTVGMLPAAACAALGLWSLVRQRLRSQQEPGGRAPAASPTVAS